ncbi:MAG: cation:proton antiporter [Pseudomonadota bacterium]
MGDLLLLAFLFLVAGVIAVPIATRFGLGSVLGYLIAGMVLAPVLGALNVDVVSVQHFAEFGVVMMLFIVGLELEPKVLWRMRHQLIGLGGLQVVLSTLVVAGAAMAFGQPWTFALSIGLIFSLSSTAIVLQSLGERGLSKSDGGNASFAVLLMQDIAVIPMLALLPLLAMPDLVESFSQVAEHAGDHGHGDDRHGDDHGDAGPSFVETLPGWLRALVTLGAIGIVILGGSRLTRPLFRFIAGSQLREMFTATALMLVIGIALLMTFVGLSSALGVFLAGVVLANSEYRHELESDIEPFKGLLLGLFFMTVGAAIDFELLTSQALPLLGMTLGLIAAKAGVLFFLGWLFKVNGSDRWLMALGLAQAGEFGFVLLSFAVGNTVLPQALADQLLLVVTLSMIFTPLLFIAFDRLIVPRYVEEQAEDADEIDIEGSVIIAGHGRFGGIINRMLTSAGFQTIVLDYSSEQLEMLRTFGFKVFFGDATRPDLLAAAGIADARMIVIAMDDRQQITELTRFVTRAYPNVHIVARAVGRNHVYELYAAGADDIIRETFDSGVRAGRSALEALGMHAYDAELHARGFVERDQRALREIAPHYDPDIPVQDNEAYVKKARELMEQQEKELRGGAREFVTRSDRGWVPPGKKVEDLLDNDE